MDEKLPEATQRDVWNKNDTINLVKFIVEQKPNNFYDENFNNVVYMQVANKLFDLGYSRTYMQCKNKWKELISSYKKHKESSSSTPPKYFAEIDKILSKDTEQNEEKSTPTFAKEISRCNSQLWSQYETSFLLKVLRIGNYVHKLKTEDPSAIYEEISKYLLKIGPIHRSKDEIRRRWKSLKDSYVKYIKGDILHFKYFEAMDALLDWEPNSVAFEEDQFKDSNEEEENIENPDDFEAKTMPTSKRALNWSLSETGILLDVVQKYDVKRMKRENLGAVFDEASMHLRLQGFKRSSEQCRVKFKHLKVKYFSVYRKVMEGDTRPGHHFFHFDRMKEILHTSHSEASSDQDMNEDMEQYDVEYLEDEDPENFQQIYLKDEPTVSTAPSYSSKKSRMLWSITETKYLLNILKAKKVKRYCRKPIFEEVAFEMEKAGFDRSARNCMIKWKNLRNQLYTCIRNRQEGKNDICPFFDEICEIIDNNGTLDFSCDSLDIEEDEEQNEQTAQDKDETLDVTPEEHFSKKRKISEPDENISDNENPTCSKMFKHIGTDPDTSLDSCKNTCNYKMDDIEHYCLSLASSFKRLDEKTQAKLKIEIQKLLYAAEFGASC